MISNPFLYTSVLRHRQTSLTLAPGRLTCLPLQIYPTCKLLLFSLHSLSFGSVNLEPLSHPTPIIITKFTNPLLAPSGVFFPTIRSVSTMGSEFGRRVWNSAPPQRPFRVCDHKRRVRKGLTAATREELLDKVSGQAPGVGKPRD